MLLTLVEFRSFKTSVDEGQGAVGGAAVVPVVPALAYNRNPWMCSVQIVPIAVPEGGSDAQRWH